MDIYRHHFAVPMGVDGDSSNEEVVIAYYYYR